MDEGLRKLYAGDFNSMGQQHHDDGTVTVTLWSKREAVKYRFRVRDLYGPDETVLEHEVLQVAQVPQYILDRMKEAKKHGS